MPAHAEIYLPNVGRVHSVDAPKLLLILLLPHRRATKATIGKLSVRGGSNHTIGARPSSEPSSRSCKFGRCWCVLTRASRSPRVSSANADRVLCSLQRTPGLVLGRANCDVCWVGTSRSPRERPHPFNFRNRAIVARLASRQDSPYQVSIIHKLVVRSGEYRGWAK